MQIFRLLTNPRPVKRHPHEMVEGPQDELALSPDLGF